MLDAPPRPLYEARRLIENICPVGGQPTTRVEEKREREKVRERGTMRWLFVVSSLLLLLTTLELSNASLQGRSLKLMHETDESGVDATLGLLQRRFPASVVESFQLESIDYDETGLEIFELDANSTSGKIIVRGTSGVALGMGIGWYMKYNINVQLSWTGNNLNFPSSLPLPQPFRWRKPLKWSYYQNVRCLIFFL